MPSIQVHGMRRGDGHQLAETIFEEIKKVDENLAKDTVVEMCDSLVVDVNFKEKPFIRVCSFLVSELEAMRKILHPLGYRIETLKLESSSPKK